MRGSHQAADAPRTIVFSHANSFPASTYRTLFDGWRAAGYEVFAVDIGVFEIKFSLNFLMNLTYSLGSLLVLAVGCILVVRGQTEIATVVTFLSATGRIVDPWNDVVDWARGLAMTTVKYGLVTQVLGTASQDTLAHTVGAV